MLDELQTLRITNLLVQKYKYVEVKTDLTSVRVARATGRSGLRVAAAASLTARSRTPSSSLFRNGRR